MLTSRFLKPFGAALTVALLGELPCLVRTALISARSPHEFWANFLGTLLGTILMMLLAVWIGDTVGTRIPGHVLRLVGGIGLVTFGVRIMTGKFD